MDSQGDGMRRSGFPGCEGHSRSPGVKLLGESGTSDTNGGLAVNKINKLDL